MFIRVISLLLMLHCTFYFCDAQTKTQELITSCGDEFKGENVTLEWSLGELLIETFDGNNLKLTQGFNQTMYTLTSVRSLKKHRNISVYPNPCSSHFFIDMSKEEGANWRIKIFDLNGKMVLKSQLTQTVSKVDIQSLTDSVYIIQILNQENRALKTMKLEKIR